MGMVTEAGELEEISLFAYDSERQECYGHIIEEVGDYLWYIALALRSLRTGFQVDYPGPDISWMTFKDASMALTLSSSQVTDLVKKSLMYGKAIMPIDLLDHLNAQYEVLRHIASMCDSSIEEAMAKNIAKLQARYPDKFTQEAALNRDLDAEKAAMA
jgi:hypothetical protein